MKSLRRYFLSAFFAIVLSLTLANATAQAWCDQVRFASEYTCYLTGEDPNYCYYDCYCNVDDQTCREALERDGFTILVGG